MYEVLASVGKMSCRLNRIVGVNQIAAGLWRAWRRPSLVTSTAVFKTLVLFLLFIIHYLVNEVMLCWSPTVLTVTLSLCIHVKAVG